MSLINDALKRASQAQKQPVPDSSAPHSAVAPPMQSAEVRKPVPSPLVVPVLAGTIVLLVLGAFVGWHLIRPQPLTATPSTPARVEPQLSAQSSKTLDSTKGRHATVSSLSVSQNVTALADAPTKVPEQDIPVQPAETPKVTNAAPAVIPVAVAPAPPAVPTFPAIKLQGIFYRKSNPTVMLNGKTLPVGGKVDGVSITKIEASAVTLEWNGETKVLELQ